MALIVATYEYDDPELRQLTAPRRDADDLADVLRDASIGVFDVTTLINEPHRTVGEAIGEFYTKARPNDLTLLYFSGHGLKDDSGKLYLAMKDTRLHNKLFTSVTADQIDQSLNDSACRQKVLILDCCYAGAFPSGTRTKADDTVHVLEKFAGRGRIVLTASDATQFAFEGDSLSGSAPQSIFTRHLIAGLRDGSADRDYDGDITVDELYDYVHEKVTEERPQQRPKKDASVSGQTVIAQNINWSLPPYLQAILSNPVSNIRLQALQPLQYLDHYFRSGNQAVRRRIYQTVEALCADDSHRVQQAAARWLDEHPIDSSGSRLADLYARAVNHFEQRQWRDAAALFGVLEQEHPGYRDAAALLAAAQRQVEELDLADRYKQGLQHLKQEHWQQAVAVFTAIEQEHPGYRDVVVLITTAQRQRDLAAWSDQAAALDVTTGTLRFPPLRKFVRSIRPIGTLAHGWSRHGAPKPRSASGNQVSEYRLR
jgi:hypothetical protein